MGLSIGLMGGTPRVLGGGGLEIQIEDTHRELSHLGHSVVRVEEASADTTFDLVHAFGSEPDNWQRVRNWYRHRVPLVVTPVISISTRWERLALRAGARLPGVMSSARMRRELLDAASAIVVLTRYERSLVVGELGMTASKVHVIGNGVNLPMPTPEDSAKLRTRVRIDEQFVLMVGRVTPWKRQADVLEEVGDAHRVVIAGPLEDEQTRIEWETNVSRNNAVWLGAVERAVLRELYGAARVLVHMSVGEVQSLAVLESLSMSTPVIANDIPANRELQQRYGSQWVRIVAEPAQVPAAIDALGTRPPGGDPPDIPTTAGAAADLAELYESVLG